MPGGFATADMWFTAQTKIEGNWSISMNLGPQVNRLYEDSPARISADEQMLYFSSERPGKLGETYGERRANSSQTEAV